MKKWYLSLGVCLALPFSAMAANIEVDLPNVYASEIITIDSNASNKMKLKDDYPLDSNKLKTSDGEMITVMYENEEGYVQSVVGYLPLETIETHSMVNAKSTALGLIWNYYLSFEGVDEEMSLKDRQTLLNKLYEDESIIELGTFMYKQMEANKDYLAGFELYQTKEYQKALQSVSKAFYEMNKEKAGL